MFDIDFNKIPVTRGKYYTLIDRDTFALYYEQRDQYKLSDLKVDEDFTIFRMARTEDSDDVIYQKIRAHIIEVDETNLGHVQGAIAYTHHGPQIKVMRLNDFGETWFFIKDDV